MSREDRTPIGNILATASTAVIEPTPTSNNSKSITVDSSVDTLKKDNHMPIEVIPAGASAVVTESHHSNHPDRWDLSTEMQRNFDQVTKNQTDFAAATALAAAHSDEENQENFAIAQKQVSDAATSTVVGFKDAAATAYQLQGQSLLEASKNAAALSVQSQKESDGLSGQATTYFNQAAVQATTNFNAVTTQVNLMQYNILLDSQKNAAASTLLATQLAAAAAAQAAECCCEIKSLIRDDGQKTRDLINSITEQNLRDRATRSEAALAAYFAAKVAPTSPVVG